MTNKYINKDNYHSIINNMNNSKINKKEKYVSSRIMKIIVIILYLSFIVISYLFYVKYKIQKRTLVIFIYILFIILFYRNYVKIAYHTSKFIQNNFFRNYS